MELKWLEDFISLANTGSFSRSATERNVTQPAFSRRIKALEVWLGTELIDRSTYPTTLTSAGRMFRATAEETLLRLGQQRDEFRTARSNTQAALRFAALHTLALTFFPGWLLSAERVLGSLNTRMMSGNLHDCVEALRGSDCDFLLCYAHEAVPVLADPARFPSLVLSRDRMIPVAKPGEHAALFPGRKDKPQRLLAYNSNSFLGRIVDHILRRNGDHHFEVCYENSMSEALKMMALEGYGVAWLPASAVERELRDGRLQRIGTPDWELPMEIRLYRSADKLHRAASALWEHALSTKTEVTEDESFFDDIGMRWLAPSAT